MSASRCSGYFPFMGFARLAVLAALLAASAGAAAQELVDPDAATMFYVRIPLGGTSGAERQPAFGLMLQGSRAYETVYLDTRMFRFLPLGGLEVKWLVAGGIAVAAAAAVHSRGKDREEQHQRAQEEQRSEQQETCKKVC
jgi:hypothetical protein